MSLKTAVLGTDRSRVSLPFVFICEEGLNVMGAKNNNFHFLRLKSFSVWQDIKAVTGQAIKELVQTKWTPARYSHQSVDAQLTETNKVFWTYVKSNRQESTGVPPLKNK